MSEEQLSMINEISKRLSVENIRVRYTCYKEGPAKVISILFVFFYRLQRTGERRNFVASKSAQLSAPWSSVIRLGRADRVYKKTYFDDLCKDIALNMKGEQGKREFVLPEVPLLTTARK